jgi:hypothetical protein
MGPAAAGFAGRLLAVLLIFFLKAVVVITPVDNLKLYPK